MGKRRHKKGMRCGRPFPEPRTLQWYLRLLGMTKRELVDRMIERATRDGGRTAGDARSLVGMLKKGHVGHVAYALALGVLQEELAWAYETNRFSRREISMLRKHLMLI